MKKALLLALVAASFSFTSCGNPDTIEATTTTEISSASDSTGMENNISPESADATTAPVASESTTTSSASPTDTTTSRQ